MKTLTAVVVGLSLTVTSSACAQFLSVRINPRPERWERLDPGKVEKAYLSGMESENIGVVESAIANVIQMRLAFPNADFKKTQVRLTQLAAGGATKAIRYKAFVAMQVFDNPYSFEDVAAVRHQLKPDELFREVAGRLEQ